jgi:hypothetical protein
MGQHTFHIPVMGTGFSIDTPLRVARFGISSVMSVVDDSLLERVRRHHCLAAGFPYRSIPVHAPDARAARITAYLDLVATLLERQMEELRALPFSPGNDKCKYFELLPDDAPLACAYREMLALPEGPARTAAAAALTAAMVAGSADVNIMTKLDRVRFDRDGQPLPAAQHDAKAALRGFAASRLDADLVLSAGMNPTLFGVLESLPPFYRDAEGHIRKGIVLKVSDWRSASVQARFLAKKGIEIKEFRVESGLNCGGHAFASDGQLLGPILEELRDAGRSFHEVLAPTIRQYYQKRGLPFVGEPRPIRVTVQGGIGTFGETRRLREHYGVDATGWATPFLLVPEATALDAHTRQQLADAGPDDLYLSDVSPLGVPFNNLRGSSSETWTRARIDAGAAGSSCPRGYLASNTEFTSKPICTASREYQRAKLDALGAGRPRLAEASPEVRAVYQKTCICHHLGNGALIDLGIVSEDAPVAVCPGPNIAYFDREYSLRELVDHIYGRRASLVPDGRPHMFAAELGMYVDHLDRQLAALPAGDEDGLARLATSRDNLARGLAHLGALAEQPALADENLASLADAVVREGARLEALWETARRRVQGGATPGSAVA